MFDLVNPDSYSRFYTYLSSVILFLKFHVQPVLVLYPYKETHNFFVHLDNRTVKIGIPRKCQDCLGTYSSNKDQF